MSWKNIVANGVIGLGQSLFNNWFANRNADKQYQRQLDFWNKQNAYNSPSAQRQRFQSAGINPNSVTGQMATAGTAQGLSSVPGNEYAQSGVLKLDSLAQTLETMARIEKIGAETGLLTNQAASELVRKSLLSVGLDREKVQYLMDQWEEKGKEMEFENLPAFFEHRNKMYDLEESYKSAQIEYEKAQTELANANTEESKASAKKLVAETGLIALKKETEKSLASLNYSRKSQVDWETRKSVVLAPLQRRALEIANQINATQSQKEQIDTAMKELELRAKSNDEGDANWWYYVDEGINAIGNILGIAIGYVAGKKTGSDGPSYTATVAY